MKYFLIVEWNHAIGEEVQGGDPWEKENLYEISEEDVWRYLLGAMTATAQGERHPHFSVKELTKKISTRSIEARKSE